MNRKSHWESIYASRASPTLSWYQRHPRRSLDLIGRTALPKSARIIDVGGGDSFLVDELLREGYSDLTVLDLSKAALNGAQARLGSDVADRVAWLEGDILEVDMPSAAFDVWHDRAVFHFLTTADQRNAYIRAVKHAVRPGGHVIVATFAEDGPTRCSGLPVNRYSAAELHRTFGAPFQLIGSEREAHRTPVGVEQRFTYCWCRYEPIGIEISVAGVVEPRWA
jgi:2-polyprenyl-3-methyl-5-hydroxy-6-metoxy-1,4-benzoquinol methylase